MSPQELSSAVEDRTSQTSVIRRVAKDRTLGTESNERSPRRNMFRVEKINLKTINLLARTVA